MELVEGSGAVNVPTTTENSINERARKVETQPVSSSATAVANRKSEGVKAVSNPPIKPTKAPTPVEAPTAAHSPTPQPVQSPAVEVVEAFYFVRPPSGGEYGPAAKATIEDWITQRRVTPDTMVCKLGTDEWVKAKDVFVMKFLFP